MLSQALHDICHATDEQQIRQILMELKPSKNDIADNQKNNIASKLCNNKAQNTARKVT